MAEDHAQRRGPSQTADSDAALALAARDDADAFAALFERYAERLFRYARARSGSPELAEDIVADTLLAAMERIEQFDPQRGSVTSWLFAMASSRIIDRQRRRGRFQRALGKLWEPNGTADDPLTTLIRQDAVTQLHVRLNQLPELDRELILLRYWAELTSAEIGEIVGLSSGNVRVRLTRILDRLGNELDTTDE
jgi:RNA polymerase sigma factor (sigma-70 family)